MLFRLRERHNPLPACFVTAVDSSYQNVNKSASCSIALPFNVTSPSDVEQYEIDLVALDELEII